ncbi:MAG TPA: class I SAM-dependent methyltransferase [Aurantimonas coralicida]|uniref:Class I SAM-dependent methyltransferase n=2 Tax=root TaxID=1 RepID=A0A9C9NE20_9HYPH|nr:class I SAM-dependent methyltransferase [Aurantimonas coralicida]HET99623.1 class I SAM-dependent methyltransferase [Aurantimonas coralicida]
MDPTTPTLPRPHQGIDYRRTQRDRAECDFYVEPAWAVEALLDVEGFAGRIWDPACGEGTIPKVLEARGYLSVIATDPIDHGYGITGVGWDFPALDTRGMERTDHIICNPPFKLAEPFVRQGLKLARSKVALLLRLAFLEGQARVRLFAETPLARVHVFARRVSMPPGGQGIEAKGGAVAFAWFVWDHGHRGPPTLHWLNPVKGADLFTEPRP